MTGLATELIYLENVDKNTSTVVELFDWYRGHLTFLFVNNPLE
jgi:hypothetical protein